MKFRIALPLILCSAVASAQSTDPNATSIPQSSQYLDSVIAVVNDGVVLQSELDDQTAVILQRLREQEGIELPPRDVLNQQILERLIVDRIQLQRAERMGIRISDEMLNQALTNVAGQAGQTINELPALLAEQGIDYNRYRRDMREQMALQQLRQIDVVGRIQVSPREIQQCLDRQIGQVNVNAEYNLSHILISVPQSATAAQFAEAEEEANDIYKQLQEGANFASLAVSFSDAGTAFDGGSLGWQRGNQIPTLFSSVAATLSPGEIAEPIKTASGFHIVKLNDTRGAVLNSTINQTRVRHILVTTNEIIDDATAMQRLGEARKTIVEGGDFDEQARLISDDPGSATEGGSMGWTEPGTFVPEFEQVVEAMEIGEVSEPFKSRYGWHILEVEERRVYNNTEEMREQNCALSLRNAKLDEETALWLRRLRDEAFVDMRTG